MNNLLNSHMKIFYWCIPNMAQRFGLFMLIEQKYYISYICFMYLNLNNFLLLYFALNVIQQIWHFFSNLIGWIKLRVLYRYTSIWAIIVVKFNIWNRVHLNTHNAHRTSLCNRILYFFMIFNTINCSIETAFCSYGTHIAYILHSFINEYMLSNFVALWLITHSYTYINIHIDTTKCTQVLVSKITFSSLTFGQNLYMFGTCWRFSMPYVCVWMNRLMVYICNFVILAATKIIYIYIYICRFAHIVNIFIYNNQQHFIDEW